MMRKCTRCGSVLSEYNPGRLCAPCQEKERESRQYASEDRYDATELASMLGLKNAESVKRLARKEGKLPRRIPGIRKCLWDKNIIDAWIKSGHQAGPLDTELAQAILIAMQKGYPIPEATRYGHDPQNLIDLMKNDKL